MYGLILKSICDFISNEHGNEKLEEILRRINQNGFNIHERPRSRSRARWPMVTLAHVGVRACRTAAFLDEPCGHSHAGRPAGGARSPVAPAARVRRRGTVRECAEPRALPEHAERRRVGRHHGIRRLPARALVAAPGKRLAPTARRTARDGRPHGDHDVDI